MPNKKVLTKATPRKKRVYTSTKGALITFRCSEKQKKKIAKLAKQRGLSVTDYMLVKGLGKHYEE